MFQSMLLGLDLGMALSSILQAFFGKSNLFGELLTSRLQCIMFLLQALLLLQDLLQSIFEQVLFRLETIDLGMKFLEFFGTDLGLIILLELL
mmetsp:Transcript_109962/g.317931  ORF Transcript_109962/g.317931 Transcript_109962/m.317931 type:complete len:92 (+) Transcript_109962:165-440(+)